MTRTTPHAAPPCLQISAWSPRTSLPFQSVPLRYQLVFVAAALIPLVHIVGQTAVENCAFMGLLCRGVGVSGRPFQLGIAGQEGHARQNAWR